VETEGLLCACKGLRGALRGVGVVCSTRVAPENGVLLEEVRGGGVDEVCFLCCWRSGLDGVSRGVG
jgi:hypothetical protein